MQYRLSLIGHPVNHSLSPLLYQAALRQEKLDYDYQLIDLAPEELAEGVGNLVKDGFAGFNVTIPHKQAVFKLCSKLTAEASWLSAVNTVKVDKQNKLIGHNTDLGGFINAVSDISNPPNTGSTACVVGSGGAARAVLFGLARLGYHKLLVITRNQEAGEKIIQQFHNWLANESSSSRHPEIWLSALDLNKLPFVPDWLINCTPIGLNSNEDVPQWYSELFKWMNPGGIFMDLVYSSDEKLTLLQRQAQRLRIKNFDGAAMLVEQAALAFEFFVNRPAPKPVMYAALSAARTSSGGK